MKCSAAKPNSQQGQKLNQIDEEKMGSDQISHRCCRDEISNNQRGSCNAWSFMIASDGPVADGGQIIITAVGL